MALFEPIYSVTVDTSLEEVLARLARQPRVERVLTLSSTSTNRAGAHSDHDLLVILSDMPMPLHVILTPIDAQLSDELFAG